MTTKPAILQPIEMVAGVEPATDATAFSTPHYTDADKIRFYQGRPQKIGGWRGFTFELGDVVAGVSRTLYSSTIFQTAQMVIGTHLKLYSLKGQRLVNVTPLQTTTIAVANSLSTDYGTLGSNPLATTAGSRNIVVTDSNASRYRAGQKITLSGATAVGGILAAAINATHIIRSVGVGNYTIAVGSAASSTATGGGASVVRATGLVKLDHPAHGMNNGDRIKVSGAVAAGGIGASLINAEHVIRNVLAGSFEFVVSGTATSSVSAAGGGATVYQKEILPGPVNESAGQGYGMGIYGTGLYGIAKTSSSGRRYPRIWFVDSFASTMIMTPGNQGGVYSWNGDSTAAPAALSGAPTAVNYVFVSNSIVVTFGAGNVQNKVLASDQGNPTQWTSSSTNQVFEDNIEGAGRLITHCPANNGNLIFTETQTYTFNYIGPPLVWSVGILDNSIGSIGPMARVTVNGTPYWMGQRNFYRWPGGNVEVIPANSKSQSTMLRYVFDNLNTSQKSKIFAWYNALFNEVQFHYPSANSNECDRVVRINLNDMSWTPDTIDRTAAEYPSNNFILPRLMQMGSMYVHESGNDADGQPLPFRLSTNLRTGGKPTALLTGVVPDNLSNASVNLQVETYRFPQSTTPVYNQSYVLPPGMEYLPFQNAGRVWRYTLTGETLGQYWVAGNWQEYVEKGADF